MFVLCIIYRVDHEGTRLDGLACESGISVKSSTHGHPARTRLMAMASSDAAKLMASLKLSIL